MQQVLKSKKLSDGIQVSSVYAGDTVDEFFRYEELIDQRVNALDLLDHPRSLCVDTIQHTIESMESPARV